MAIGERMDAALPEEYAEGLINRRQRSTPLLSGSHRPPMHETASKAQSVISPLAHMIEDAHHSYLQSYLLLFSSQQPMQASALNPHMTISESLCISLTRQSHLPSQQRPGKQKIRSRTLLRRVSITTTEYPCSRAELERCTSSFTAKP